MASIFSEDNEVLIKLWKEHNPQEEEYLQKEKVVGWIKAVLEVMNAMENVQSSLTDIDGLIREFLTEVHAVNQDNTQHLALNYGEAVDFLRWLTHTDKEGQHSPEVEKEGQIKDELEAKEEEAEPNNQNQQHIQQENALQKSLYQLQSNKNEEKMNDSQQNLRQIHHQHTQQHKENGHNFKKVKTEINLKEHENLNSQKQQQDLNQNITNNPNQFNIEQISKKYKDYLKVIFDHYCKASYATGQDPTFEQIMHKTTIMTITKFMLFCKDFEISKFNPVINRNFLIETFKKNSECYKEMSFQQFCEVFNKLSFLGVQQKPKQQIENIQGDQKALISSQMVKILQFCEISTAKKFKQKMKKLNIQFRVGPKTNAQLKVVPQGYKFKYTSNNGKSQQQIKQQLNERKIHRSQRRIFLRQKVNLNHNDLSLNKRNPQLKKKELNLSKQAIPQTQSTRIINKILTPLAPPVKKVPLLPPPPPKPNNTPNQNNLKNNSNTANTNNPNIFKKQMGYAELHKVKQSQGYSRKRANTNSNPRINDERGMFKLNSIVQQARMQMMELGNQGTSQHLTESLATNSRQETHRIKVYDMNRINNKMQEINDKIKRDREIQQQLTGLLDMDNDEQDEYLMEHLERQKKNEVYGKRLSNKINQLDVKR